MQTPDPLPTELVPEVNCYTVNGLTVERGIRVARDGYLEAGEAGRGRTLVTVPIPAGADVQGNRLLFVPTHAPTDLVVRFPDHSGYRGSWSLRFALPPEWWAAHVRRAVAHKPPDGAGALAPGHTFTDGWAPPCPLCPPNPAPDLPAVGTTDAVRVIARGVRAQGLAGRMGHGPEYIVVMTDGATLEIDRSGRLYGGAGTINVRNAGGVLETFDPREVAVRTNLARPVW